MAVHEEDGSASTPPPPPPPPVVSAAPVSPPPALSLSSSPPQPDATSASAATSSAMKATNPRFFNVPPSPRKEPATCAGSIATAPARFNLAKRRKHARRADDASAEGGDRTR